MEMKTNVEVDKCYNKITNRHEHHEENMIHDAREKENAEQ